MPALPMTVTNQRRAALMPDPWKRIATGETPLEDLSDEEVLKGRLRRSDGTLGPRPAFYPQNFIDEQVKRSLSWSSEKIREGALEAIETIRDIMNNPEISPSERLKAAMFFTDRFLGKEVQRVLVAAEDPVETLFRSILATPGALELSAADRELLS